MALCGQIPLKVRNSRCKLEGSRYNDLPQPKVLLGSPTIRLCDCVFQAIICANVAMKKQSTALKVRDAAVNWNPTNFRYLAKQGQMTGFARWRQSPPVEMRGCALGLHSENLPRTSANMKITLFFNACIT
jgi:hypothetical protein